LKGTKSMNQPDLLVYKQSSWDGPFTKNVRVVKEIEPFKNLLISQGRKKIGVDKLKVMFNWGKRKRDRYIELCGFAECNPIDAYNAVEFNRGVVS